MKSTFRNFKFIIATLVFIFQFGCANIKLISSDNNQHKFCTNPGNKIAKDRDFENAASTKCNGSSEKSTVVLNFSRILNLKRLQALWKFKPKDAFAASLNAQNRTYPARVRVSLDPYSQIFFK